MPSRGMRWRETFIPIHPNPQFSPIQTFDIIKWLCSPDAEALAPETLQQHLEVSAGVIGPLLFLGQGVVYPGERFQGGKGRHSREGSGISEDMESHRGL